MNTTTIGPYRVLRILGGGGMGIVYHAEGLLGEVALKVAHAQRDDARHGELLQSSLDGLRREIAVLSRLRHAGLVRFFESGLFRGLPWYAMQLIPGGSLRAWVRGRWATAPERVGRVAANGHLAEVLRVGRALCQTLAFLHGEGVLHRDLKPENVLFSKAGPVLVDFGLMRRFAGGEGRESLDFDHTAAGTRFYTAPEQLRGDEPDARADLYSLGAMLYEMVHGEAPSAESKPLTEGVPEGLSALLSRLLAPRPWARPGYAEEVSESLAALGGELEPRYMQPTPRPYLYRPRFSGRADLLQSLQPLLWGAQQGQGRAALLSGPSGGGKTRVAIELARRAQRAGVTVVSCEAQANHEDRPQGAPLSALRGALIAIADRCFTGGASLLEAQLGPLLRILESYEPALALLPSRARFPAPPPLPPERAQDRVRRAMTEVLYLLAAQSPLLLVVDDLQWADAVSLAVLEGLLQHASGPLSLLLTCRSEALGASHLQALLSSPRVEMRQVERLGTAELERVAAGMLAVDSPPEGVAQLIAACSAGNPLFVAEYLKSSLAEGTLRREAGGWSFSLPGNPAEWAPGAIQALVGRRIAGLPENARRLAQAGAVLGREWSPEIACEVAGLYDDEALSAREELRRRQVVEESGARLRFVHEQLREASYRALSSSARAALHRRAADALTRSGAAPRELAYQHQQAGDSARAFWYASVAGEQSLSEGAYREASRLLQTALYTAEAIPALEESRRLRLWRLAADTAASLGEVSESGRRYSRVIETATGRPLPRGTLGWVASLATRAGVELLRLAGLCTTPSPAERASLAEAAHAASRLSTYHLLRGNPLAALSVQLLALDLGTQTREPVARARAGSVLGGALGVMGFHPAARYYLAQARSDAQSSGDLVAACIQATMEAIYHNERGSWEDALSCIAPLLTRCEAAGAHFEAEQLRISLVITLCNRGDFRTALTEARTLLASAQDLGHTLHQHWGCIGTGTISLWLGEHDAAIQALSPLFGKVADEPTQLSGLAMTALAHERRGARPQAIQLAEECLARLARTPNRHFSLRQLYEFLPALLFSLSSTGETRWQKAAAELCQGAARFARLFPTLRPVSLRHQAQAIAPRNPERAFAFLQKSISQAEMLRMPHEQAASLLAWAELSPRGAERAARAQRARDLFASLGCLWHQGQAEALGAAPPLSTTQEP